ncbi:ABC transporter substrate-binding protein [Blautia producta]|uniref:ABC transporter substrate-binding protein YesO n=1 Tax=Blautia producta TaxID=33035 RepID=A0A4P6LXG9_9FIRM|nr:sugar ABC transporter substrate-binding protein [Blautia producta]QBE97291.1 Putative ABC transporter substrate-binding protein YesO [Blautia producta]
MRRKTRRTAAAMLAGVMTLSLAACGSGDGDSAKKDTSDDGKTTIKITWWGGQSRHDYTQKMLDLYTESHPDVKFEAIPSGWDGYFDKLSTQAASGSMPDIVQMDYLYLTTYAKNNSVADLQQFIDDGTIDVSNIDEDLLSTGESNDILAGAVLSSSLMSVGYNPDVFKEAGLEEPTSEWTWNDFIEINKTIKEKTGKYGAAMSPVIDTNNFNYWVRQHGGQLFSDDNKSLGYEDDQIFADYINMFKGLMDEGSVPNPDEWAQIETLGQEAGPVVTGDGAMIFEWNNYAAKLSSVNDKLKIVTPPLSDDSDDKGLWMKPGMFFSISENSKVKKEAAEFIDWFINSEEANDLMMAERGTPASSKIRQYMIDSGKLNTQQQEMFQYVDDAAVLCGDTPAPDPVGMAEINEAFKNVANSAFLGQATPEEAAKDFREQTEQILSRNN